MVATRPRTASRILVADDQADVLEALRWLLTGEGYEPEFVSSTDAVLERLRERPFDLLLMDLNYSRDTTSGREGLELIPQVRAHDASLPIVVMTGWEHRHRGQAMRRGAVQKPWTTSRCSRSRARDRRRRRRSAAKQQRDSSKDSRAASCRRRCRKSMCLASSWKPANGVGGDYSTC
jgi:DNA-binding NtrC family response regulator